LYFYLPASNLINILKDYWKKLIIICLVFTVFENRASNLLLGILVMCTGQRKFCIDDTARAVGPCKLVKIDKSVDKKNASNTSWYKKSRPQNVIPTDVKTLPSSSTQPHNRAVANIRQQVQQKQGILLVNPIQT
jgi:hypothetical protein